MDTLHALFEAWLPAAGDTPAIGAPGRPMLTYREVHAGMLGIARALRANGIARGERVALALPNGPEAALGFLGVAIAATAAPLNPGYSRDEFAFYLEDLQARALIADAAVAPAAIEAAEKLGVRVLSFPALTVHQGAGGADSSSDDWAEADDVALVLHTSGTTARPKIVPLTHRNLTASARNIAASLGLDARDRCLNIMPLFHVHGLLGAVASTLASGGAVACTPGFDAERFPGWLEEFRATWYTGVPTMHQAIAARAAASDAGSAAGNGCALRFIRSCSSALPPTLMAELEARFNVPVIEAYGMTEASHQVASNPLPPRARKPGSVGVAAGTEVAVLDEAGAPLAPGTRGEIAIKGPGVTRGYASPPEANQKAFVNGWFRTGDQGYIDADGYVFLTGRIKELINRGGEKVAPREIDEALLQHPAVAQAVAFAVAHPTLGEDVAAAVVLRAGATATEMELREFALERLAGFKVPSQIVIVPTIPKGPTGKLQRIGLADKLGDRLAAAYVAPQEPVAVVLADIWQEVLGVPRVGARDNFFALGGDSLRAARVTTRVNELFAVQLLVTTAFRRPTVEQFAAAIRESADPGRLAAIAATLQEIQDLSDAEVQRLLDEESGRG